MESVRFVPVLFGEGLRHAQTRHTLMLLLLLLLLLLPLLFCCVKDVLLRVARAGEGGPERWSQRRGPRHVQGGLRDGPHVLHRSKVHGRSATSQGKGSSNYCSLPLVSRVSHETAVGSCGR